MYDSVLTIVSPAQQELDDTRLTRLLGIVKACGVGGVEAPVWLAPGRAADIFFEGANPVLYRLLREKLSAVTGLDMFVQSNDEFRRKKLLMSDMDATVVIGETIDEMAAHFNLKDKIAPITVRAMRGEIGFPEALRERVGLLQGQPAEELEVVAQAICYAPGAEQLVKTMARFGARCVLISGGFDFFTGRVAQVLGFHEDYANRLEIVSGKLTGDVLPPLVDKDFKKKTLEDEAHTLGVSLAATMAVGDGANDIPMLQTAGAGVGYFGKPAVEAAVPHQVRHTDLTALLYMQGYKRSELIP